MVFGSSHLSSKKKKIVKVGPPLTKLSGSTQAFYYAQLSTGLSYDSIVQHIKTANVH